MSSVKTIYYSDARCGAGKTHWAIGQMAEQAKRVVLAVDRKEVAAERATAIKARAHGIGLTPQVRIVLSDDDKPSRGGSVADRIAGAHTDLSGLDHAVLIISHAALRLADLTRFVGWNLIIDEAPKLLEHMVQDTGAMFSWLEANYGLVGPDNDGSYAIDFQGAFTITDIAKKGSRDWLNFHQMVLTGGATCDIGSWRERERWSAWRHLQASVLFKAFDEVSILADSFTETEAYLLMAQDPGVDFQEIGAIQIADRLRPWKPRDVLVQYYLADRAVSDSLLKSAAFKSCLKAIGRHIAETTAAHDHLWSCNDDEAGLLKGCGIPGTKVQPIQAGANQFDQITSVTMLYSAKPSPEASALYRRWTVGSALLVAAREYNAIRQFVMRSNARVPDSSKGLTIRVYDRSQADDLERYLTGVYGFKVGLEHVDLGFETVKPEGLKQGRAAPLTIEEKRARQAVYTKRWRESLATSNAAVS